MKSVSEFLAKIGQGENIIYRGHADEQWELKPSIGRHFSEDWKRVLDFEKESLEGFKNRSIPYLKYKPTSDIEWLCLMQHHGCSTRLLDFTTNPLIALFFASDPSELCDGEVIVAKYGRSYDNVNDQNLFERTHNFAYHPPHITERIIGQSGCFVFSAKPNTSLNEKQIETIKIPLHEKYALRSQLRKLGISDSLLFPGMDGVCQDLNDILITKLILETIPF